MKLLKSLRILLGIGIISSTLFASNLASANSQHTFDKKEIQKVVKATGKSEVEVTDLLDKQWEQYEQDKKNWKDTIKKQKQDFKLKVDKLSKQTGKNKEQIVSNLLPKLAGKSFTYDEQTGEISVEGSSDAQPSMSTLATTSTSYSLGDWGDVLVTLDSSSSSGLFGGHAGIVSNVSSNWTLESLAYGFSSQSPSEDGVMWQINDWKNRYNTVAGYWVLYADGTKYTAAANYAEAQLYEPYNWNFFDKWTTSSWYCSQLVWKSWYNQGYELDGQSNGAVPPVDLTKTNKVYAYYSKGM